MAGRPKGIPNPNGGRKKGSKDKVQRAAKENILKVFETLNPDDNLKHMTDWAKEDPTEFYKLYAKLLPKNVDVNASGELTITIAR